MKKACYKRYCFNVKQKRCSSPEGTYYQNIFEEYVII
jgi:hypothetical protein